jgi:hypothetical protein
VLKQHTLCGAWRSGNINRPFSVRGARARARKPPTAPDLALVGERLGNDTLRQAEVSRRLERRNVCGEACPLRNSWSRHLG